MTDREVLPARSRAPRAGFSSLLLLLGMLGLLGLVLAGTRPLAPGPGLRPLGETLPVVLLAGGLVGAILATSSLGVLRAHFLGAVVATVILLSVAGGAVLGIDPLPASLADVSARVVAVWDSLDNDVDLFILQAGPPVVAVFLVLGAIGWTTAQFSAFAIFRYERGGPAVLSIGAVLFLDLAITSLEGGPEQVPTLVALGLFATLAMLLLIRLQLLHQQAQWARRHIQDAEEVSRLFLRTGVVFVVVSVIGATSMTAVATVRTDDLDLGEWQGPVDDVSAAVSDLLAHLGVISPVPLPGPRPDHWVVSPTFPGGDGTAFTATVDDPEPGGDPLLGNYWWGWQDDRFDGWGWRSTVDHRESVAADDRVPTDAADTDAPRHRLSVTLTVGGAGLTTSQAFVPSEPRRLSVPTSVAIGNGETLGDIRFAPRTSTDDSFTVDASVLDYTPASDLSARQLREAGTRYPAWVTERYLQGQGDRSVTGPDFATRAMSFARADDDRYAEALAVQDWLREMEYEPRMDGVCEGYPSIPDCVISEQKGFCQHFATTMTMIMRELGVPARIITGYLPGQFDGTDWTVLQRAYHTWVEVYYPTIGWVRFDPTPPALTDDGQERTAFPPGPSGPRGPDRGDAATEPPDRTPESPEPEPSAVAPYGGVTTGDDDTGVGPLELTAGGVAAVILLLLALAAIVSIRVRRLPGGDPGLAYRGIVSLARRLGHGPHPAQTELEFTATLSEVVPAVREDLYVVTRARVESAYGRRTLSPDRRAALGRAYAHARTALVRRLLRRRA
jgi:transglutaminase-like putative cysteine protease